MKTTYLINPRIKKHWFKQNSVVYDLIKYSEKEVYIYNGLDEDLISQKTEKVIFSSLKIEEVIIIKNNLER